MTETSVEKAEVWLMSDLPKGPRFCSWPRPFHFNVQKEIKNLWKGQHCEKLMPVAINGRFVHGSL